MSTSYTGMHSMKAMTCKRKLKPTKSNGYTLKVVRADTLYGSRDNRNYLERHRIRFSGKPLGARQGLRLKTKMK